MNRTVDVDSFRRKKMTGPIFLAIFFLIMAVVLVRASFIMRRVFSGAFGKFALVFILAIVGSWLVLRAGAVVHF